MKRIAFAALLFAGLSVATAWPQAAPAPAAPSAPLAPATPAAPAAPASGGILSQIPPEAWSALFSALGMFAIAVLHLRGNNVPVISPLLNNLGNAPQPTNPSPATPANPNTPMPALGQGLLVQLIRQEVAAAFQLLMTPPQPAPKSAPPATSPATPVAAA